MLKQLTAEDLKWDFVKAGKAALERQQLAFVNKFNEVAEKCKNRRERSCRHTGIACAYHKCPKLV